MANAKQRYSLPKDLEGLVQFAMAATELKDSAQTSGARISRNLRGQARTAYNALVNAGLTTVDPRAIRIADRDQFEDLLRNGEVDVYDSLSTRVDDPTYSAARKGLLDPLDEQHKLGYYVEMLEGLDNKVLPSAPANAKDNVKASYEALKRAKGELTLAKAIETAVLSGDTEGANDLVQRYLSVSARDTMEVYAGMGAPIIRNVEKDTYLRIANARRSIAADLIVKNKLHGAIDEGVGKSPDGKARSLVGMYKAYAQQEADNAKQAKAAAARRP